MDRTATDVALTLITGALRSGGATTSRRVNDTVPSTGYMVGGVAQPLELKLETLQPHDVVSWLERTEVPAGAYVGSWTSDGVLYVDVSEHCTDRLESEIRGLERGELAIWDITAGEEIRLS